MSYSVSQERWSEELVYVLRGPVGTQATVCPGVGANLIGLALSPSPGAAAVSVVSRPPDSAALAKAPTRYGSPVLFPYPSRISRGRFRFEGKEYQLDVYPDGNSRHGFVASRPFAVVDQGANGAGAWVTVQFDGDVPDIQRQFPFPFQLSLTLRLDEGGLAVDAVGKNTGLSAMPAGFGWHPYFRMPLLPGGGQDKCLLRVPARRYWKLAEDLVPTGCTLPVSGKLDMLAGRPVGDQAYDDMLTDLARDAQGWSHASFVDEAAGLEVTVSAGPTFREWVIYTPPERTAVCLEPYTCPGNAFNMQEQGIDAGVQRLAPGEQWADSMRVSVSPI